MTKEPHPSELREGMRVRFEYDSVQSTVDTQTREGDISRIVNDRLGTDYIRVDCDDGDTYEVEPTMGRREVRRDVKVGERRSLEVLGGPIVNVVAYGYAYHKIPVTVDEWAGMSHDERLRFLQRHYGRHGSGVTPTDVDSMDEEAFLTEVEDRG